jgi:hypothetical protein
VLLTAKTWLAMAMAERLAQIWASREALAGPTLHGVPKSVTPPGVCPQLQMCSSRTERVGVRSEYVGAVRPLVIERDTFVLSPHMQLDSGVRRHDGRGMGPNLHRLAHGRAAIPLGGHVKQAATGSQNVAPTSRNGRSTSGGSALPAICWRKSSGLSATPPHTPSKNAITVTRARHSEMMTWGLCMCASSGNSAISQWQITRRMVRQQICLHWRNPRSTDARARRETSSQWALRHYPMSISYHRIGESIRQPNRWLHREPHAGRSGQPNTYSASRLPDFCLLSRACCWSLRQGGEVRA